MEGIKKKEKFIIVIINNIKGNILRLNSILDKISKQNPIDYLFLTGEVFSFLIKEDDILSISFKGTIIIFDTSPIGDIIRSKYEYKNYILKNNIFLGRSGIFSLNNSSINIAFLNGIESKELLDKNNANSNLSYTNKFYKYNDIENIINNYKAIINKENNKIDFFLINSFPQSLYERYFEIIQNECSDRNSTLKEEEIYNSISYSLNYLLYLMNPRYIISSVDDFFYKNINDIVVNGSGYRTFFYNLGYLEDKINKSENFFIAINYKSINDMEENEIIFLEKEQEEKIGQKFIKDKNIFKYFEFYELNKDKTLIENYNEYLKICFNDNRIKSIKEKIPVVKPLLISNLNYNTTENEIKNYLINKYGSIKSIKLLTNKENKFNGKAIVEFNNVNSMKEMLNNNGKDKFNERIIRPMIYIPRDQLINNSNNNNNLTNNNNSRNNNIAECWFCYDDNEKLERKYIISDFNYFYLAYPKGPIDKYHFLIVPKKHISSYIYLNRDEKIECEMIIQLVKDYLYSKEYDYIVFEKNLKYNFSNTLHMLINVCGVENIYIEKLNIFAENFLIDEKMNDFIVSFNEKYLDLYNEKDEYIYINIPKVYKQKIIRKIIFIKTKEYKIDYPRKLICNLINKEERLNWKNTINLGEEFLYEIRKEMTVFLKNNILYK